MRLPRAKEAARVLQKLGFLFSRQKGGHAVYRNDQGIRATIPVHGRKELSPAVFKQILKDLNISAKEFWNL